MERDLHAGGWRGVRANRWFDDRRHGLDREHRVQRLDGLDRIRHQLRKQQFLDRDWQLQLPQQHAVRQLGEVATPSGVQRQHTGEPAVK